MRYFIALLLAVSATQAMAMAGCPCKSKPEEIAAHSLVVKGQVLKIEPSNIHQEKKITFRVDERVKGAAPSILSFYTPSSEARCGADFDKDERAEVAVHFHDGTRHVSRCGVWELPPPEPPPQEQAPAAPANAKP